MLLYRSQVKKDVSHLLVARSDAGPLDLPCSPFHGRPVSQFEVVTKFRDAVRFSTIAGDDALRQWTEVRRRFVRSAVPIPEQYWQRLFELAGEHPGGLEQQAVDGLRRYRYEKDVQEWLFRYPSVLKTHGLCGLTEGRKEVFLAAGSRADLVFIQGRGALRRTVVLELKRGVVGPAAVDQVLRYREHLTRERSGLRRATAVLVGTELHPNAESAAKRNGVRFIALGDLNLARARDELRSTSPTPHAEHPPPR